MSTNRTTPLRPRAGGRYVRPKGGGAPQLTPGSQTKPHPDGDRARDPKGKALKRDARTARRTPKSPPAETPAPQTKPQTPAKPADQKPGESGPAKGA